MPQSDSKSKNDKEIVFEERHNKKDLHVESQKEIFNEDVDLKNQFLTNQTPVESEKDLKLKEKPSSDPDIQTDFKKKKKEVVDED